MSTESCEVAVAKDKTTEVAIDNATINEDEKNKQVDNAQDEKNDAVSSIDLLLGSESETPDDMTTPAVEASTSSSVVEASASSSVEVSASQTSVEVLASQTSAESQTSVEVSASQSCVEASASQSCVEATASQSSVTSQSSVEASTSQSSVEEAFKVVEPGANVPEAAEVVDRPPPNIVEHSEYAECVIAKAPVRLRIRRTVPTLFKHRCQALTQMYLFDAIDDGCRIALCGSQWKIGSHSVTVVLVGTLGYAQEKEDRRRGRKKRSAKLDCDRTPVSVVVRPTSMDSQPIRFKDLRRITAVKLFKEGTPFAHIDTLKVTKFQLKLETFVGFNEVHDNGESWLRILPLFPVVVELPPAVSTPIVPDERRSNAKSAAKCRKKRKATKLVQEENAKRVASMKVLKRNEEKRKRDREQQRMRRYVHKVLEDNNIPNLEEKLDGLVDKVNDDTESREIMSRLVAAETVTTQLQQRLRTVESDTRQVLEKLKDRDALLEKKLQPILQVQKTIMARLSFCSPQPVTPQSNNSQWINHMKVPASASRHPYDPQLPTSEQPHQQQQQQPSQQQQLLPLRQRQLTPRYLHSYAPVRPVRRSSRLMERDQWPDTPRFMEDDNRDGYIFDDDENFPVNTRPKRVKRGQRSTRRNILFL